MILRRTGDILLSTDDLICIPTNSTLKMNGELVMGAGLALQVKKAFPETPAVIGDYIAKGKLENRYYGVLAVPNTNLLCVQTKRHYTYDSERWMVSNSMGLAVIYALGLGAKTLSVPLLGAGCGSLSNEVSTAIIEHVCKDVDLDVTIWTRT